ncbi:MAG: sugar ABC transporter substrate-binding protein [Eubacteriales bacterium]|nr:sugar ABC transporter substrate-binding protein [Eubacteriales bacterium]
MNKRLWSAALALAVAAPMLVGNGVSVKAEAKTLEVWLPPLDDDTVNSWKPLLEEWEKEKDCTVNITIVPWSNYEETYTTALNAGTGPDVGYMYNEMFPTYIDAGVVEDMSEYVQEEDSEEYKYLSNGYMMDGQYGWPLVTGVPFILYYNVDILDELQETPPQTWEDLLRICEKAQQDTDGDGEIDRYGYAAGMSTSDVGPMQILNAYYYSALWQNGGQIYTDDLKKAAFADEAGQEALTWIKDLSQYMNPDFMSMSWSEAFSNVFAQGNAAFGVYRSSQVDETLFAENYPDLNWDYVTSLKNKDFGTFGATDCLTLMSAAEDKELAMDFIKYVTGAEFMEQYHAKCPGAALTVSEPYAGDEKMERIYTEDKDQWHGLQVGPCGVDILTQLAADFQGAMSGEMTVEEALAEAEDYANGLLEDYWAERE